MHNFKKHFWLGHRKQSAVAKHGWWMGHEICFSEVAKLFQSNLWRKQGICEDLEIHLEMEVLNREDGLRLSATWLHVLDLVGCRSKA